MRKIRYSKQRLPRESTRSQAMCAGSQEMPWLYTEVSSFFGAKEMRPTHMMGTRTLKSLCNSREDKKSYLSKRLMRSQDFADTAKLCQAVWKFSGLKTSGPVIFHYLPWSKRTSLCKQSQVRLRDVKTGTKRIPCSIPILTYNLRVTRPD